MTLDTGLAVVGAACSVIITIATWGFVTGRWATDGQYKMATLVRDMEALRGDMSRRFDEANEHSSKLTSYVQGMESRFLREFVSREVAEERFRTIQRDCERLQMDVQELRRGNGSGNGAHH